MRRFALTLLTVLIAAAPVAAGVPVSAASGKCTTRGVVAARKVCLPGAKKGSLSWQTRPATGKSCLRTGVTYKTLICAKAAGKLKWVINPATTTVEQARAEVRALLDTAHQAFYDSANIVTRSATFKRIEYKYQAYATDLALTLTGYSITMNGVKTCYAATVNTEHITDTAC